MKKGSPIVQYSQTQASHPSRRKVAKTFGLKAVHYDQFALFQAQSIQHLVTLYKDRIKDNQVWVDLGCGTGLFSKILQEHKKSASLIGLDISPESLKLSSQSTRYSVLADIEAVPFKNESIDGFVIASVIQWIADIKRCMQNLNECLTKNGVALFSVFTSESFYEHNVTKRSIGLTVPVSLPSEGSFFEILKQCGFSIPRHDKIEHTYYFPTALDALKSISSYGATAAADALLTKSKIKQLCTDYEDKFRCNEGIPVTYKAITGIAEKDQ
jgi:malonyl-CoA O-methyltransferase